MHDADTAGDNPLAEDLTLRCGQRLPNRILKSAMSEGLGTASLAPDVRLERLYRRWGSGGYGLLISGNVMVDRRHLGEPGNVALEDDRDLDAIRRWADAARHAGTPVWMQLNHPGRQSNPLATRHRPVAPSAIALRVPGMMTPRALTDDEVEDVVHRFVAAATVAESAGFDGVQVHAAHGYLISQFLSPAANRRDDRWGGDRARRAALLLAVVDRIRAAVSPGFGVGVKLNSADFQRGGFSEEDAYDVVERLVDRPIDLLEISGGSYESAAMMGRPRTAASTREREAYFLDFARSVADRCGDVALAVTGGFRTRAVMAEAVAEGACDLVGLGRPAAVVPDAARRLLDGADRIHAPGVTMGVPGALGRNADVRAVDGLIDLQWHTDQLHRLGDGVDPDPRRPWWRTTATMLSRNGLDAFRSVRGSRRGPSERRAAVG